MAITDRTWYAVDSFVEAYESALVVDKSANLDKFLPDKQHADYERISVELMRVGMEHAAKEGRKDVLSEYQVRFPDLLSDPRHLKELAFEDYRLRRHDGEFVTPAEYRDRYHIDTDDWGDTGEITNREPTLRVEDLGEAPLRLVSAIRDFPSVGTRFADFEITRIIGQGTFGRVFIAKQGELAERHVVLKVTGQRSLEPERLARLQHANIVPVYSVHNVDRLMAVCMPYFGETTLSHVIDELSKGAGVPKTGAAICAALSSLNSSQGRGGRSNDASGNTAERPNDSWHELEQRSYVDACLWIVRGIAQGLAHAHRRGIIHQDLKPANILMADDGRPMLLDFNAALDKRNDASSVLCVGGTLPYMAPEHVRSLRGVGVADSRCDVFSLGVLFYQLLTLRLPYPDRSWSDPIGAIADRENGLPSLRKSQPQASAAIEAIVNRCLDPDPTKRYQSAEELEDDLDRQLRNQPLRHIKEPWRERSRKWRRRSPRLTVALKVATGCMLLLAAVSWTISSRYARLEQLRSSAVRSSRVLNRQLHSLYVPLAICGIHDDSFQHAWRTTSELTAMYRLGSGDLESSPLYVHLPEEERLQVRHDLSELLYLRSEAQRKIALSQTDADARLYELQQARRWNRQGIDLHEPQQVPHVLTMQRERLLWHMDSEQKQLETSSNSSQSRLAGQVTIPPLAPDALPKMSVHTTSSLISAVEALRNRQFRFALEHLEVVRQDYPVSYSTWILLGNANTGLRRFREADHCYTTAAALWKSSSVPIWLRGLERLTCGRYADAIEDFSKVLQREPSDWSALLNRAVARYELKDYQEADKDLTSALRYGATQTRLFFLRARVRQKLGMLTEAEEDRQEGLRRIPTDELSWIARGIARLPNDVDGALDDFREAWRRYPYSRPAQRNMAYVLGERLNDQDAALVILNNLVNTEGAHVDDIVSRGVYHARQGNRDAAIADAHLALKTSATDKVHYQVACIYSLTSRHDSVDKTTALAHLGQSLRLNHSQWGKLAQTDSDLDPIRNDVRFAELLQAAETLEDSLRRKRQ